MAKEDKGLLEDLIGEEVAGLEEGTEAPTQTQVNRLPSGAPPMPSISDDMDDDQLMGELIKHRGGAGKKFIILGILLLIVGGVGAAIKFNVIPVQKLFAAKKTKVTRIPMPKVSPPSNLKGGKPTTDVATGSAPQTTPPQMAAPSAPVPGAPTGAVNPIAPGVPMTPQSPPSSQSGQGMQFPKTPQTPQTAQAPQTPQTPMTSSAPVAQPQAPEISKPAAPPQAPVAPAPKAPELAMKPSAPSAPSKTFVPVEKSRSGVSAEGNYHIQVGAYLFKSSLKVPLEKINQLGLRPEIGTTQRKVKMKHVLAGNWDAREIAEAAQKDLAQEGIHAKIVELPGGNYSVLAGTFFYVAQAKSLRHKLEEFGYEARVEDKMTPQTLQEIHVGPYVSEQAAESDLARLREQGLQPVVVTK